MSCKGILDNSQQHLSRFRTIFTWAAAKWGGRAVQPPGSSWISAFSGLFCFSQRPPATPWKSRKSRALFLGHPWVCFNPLLAPICGTPISSPLKTKWAKSAWMRRSGAAVFVLHPEPRPHSQRAAREGHRHPFVWLTSLPFSW